MKHTNKYGLPEAFVRAVTNDPYTRGGADFSVTELLKPSRASALERRHAHELEEDVINRVYSLLGQSVHGILERGAREGIDIVEKRYFMKVEVDGETYTLSGQIDHLAQDTGTLSDWKVTKAYAFSKKGGRGKKPEWVAQLNMQLELLRQNGLDARELQIVGILRDWDKRKIGDASGYPETEIIAAPIPIWEREKTLAFIKARVKAHVDARQKLPQCTTAETWAGNRCKAYCPAAKFCDQYKQMLKTGLVKSEDEIA